MLRILLVVGIVALLVFGALIVSVTVAFDTGTARNAPGGDLPPYGERGPYPVGVRSLARDNGAPLDMMIWYPATDGARPDANITYPIRFGMPAPFGIVKYATYAGGADRGAPYDLAGGPYPLVVLSPGLSIGAAAYGWLAEHLASYQLVVIAPEHKEQLDGELDILWQSAVMRPSEIQAVLAYVDRQAGAGGTLEGLVDKETVAVIGHSYGGYTSLALAGARFHTESFATRCEAVEPGDPGRWLCDKLLPHMADMARLAGLDAVPEGLWPSWSDPRVDAVVSMAGDAYLFGEAGLAEISAPLLAIGGTADRDTPYMWSTHPAYEHVSSPAKARVALENAGHMIFTAPCEAIPPLLRLVSAEFCSDADWDRYRAHDLVKHFTTAFLLAELAQDAEAASALRPEHVQFADLTYHAQGY